MAPLLDTIGSRCYTRLRKIHTGNLSMIRVRRQLVSRVVITGSKGTIGSVLYEGLREQHQVTGLDLPEGDISNYDFLLSQLHGANTVIHVAYSANPSTREGALTGSINP